APRRKPMFVLKRLKVFLAAVLVLALAAAARWGGTTSLFERLVYGTVGAVRVTWLNTLLPYGGAERAKLLLAERSREVVRLRRRNAALEERLRRLSAERGGVPAGGDAVYVTARVAGRDPRTWRHEVVVDRGSRDGVRAGAMVMDHAGLVGRTSRVSGRTARVRLITDPGTATSCKILPADAYCIAMGTGSKTLRLELVPAPYRVGAGDRVVTSGYGGHYPPGIPIGRVSSVIEQSHRLTKPVTCRPSARLDRMDYVMIIVEGASGRRPARDKTPAREAPARQPGAQREQTGGEP
ncbi:MAG: rod shape-determining protein MreC, partial [bacterium]